MKKMISAALALTLSIAILTGCGAQSAASSSAGAAGSGSSVSQEASSSKASSEAVKAALPDGVYQADFKTDSSMFSVSEALNGKGTLTVTDGVMTIHVSLMSQKILNLYVGMAEDAQKSGAAILEPSVDTVTYSDGLSDEVYGFDIPVPAIGEEFDVALIGTKGKWYDHKVSVENPEPIKAAASLDLEDGSYTCAVTLEGGSGRATVESPAALTVKDGKAVATIVWSSPNYDYMKVNEEKYLPTNTSGNSTFEIPVAALDTPLAVVANTVAMSTPREVEYTLTFDSGSIAKASK